MIKLFQNPFYIYVFSFLIVLVVYSFNWSNMYPDLSLSMIVFLLSTFLIYFFLGLIVQKMKIIRYKQIQVPNNKIIIFLILIWIGHIAEFLYEKKVPLYNLLFLGEKIDYLNYGIKSFHVILLSFNSFVVVYFFHCFLSRKEKKMLYAILIALLPFILIISRGSVIVCCISCLFLWIQIKKSFFSFKQILYTIIGFLILLYFFGVMGNYRSQQKDSTLILKAASATNEFNKNIFIPNEYFWTYLYISSPLANFQNTVNKTKEVDYNLFNILLFEIIPDFVSKRIANSLDIKNKKIYQVRPWLTASGIYSGSYLYAKWLGPIIMSLYLIFVCFSVFILIPKTSKYHITTISILSTIILMNTFDNMLAFSGIMFQLLYPIFFSLFESKNINLKNI